MNTLETICLRQLLTNIRLPKNVIFISVEQDAPVIKTRRLRPPAVISEKTDTSDDNYLQCLSVTKTAKILDVNAVTVRRMLKSGRLQGPKDGRLTRVFRSSLERYLTENTTVPENQDPTQPTKPKRCVKSTSHQIAMRKLKECGIL